MSAEDLTQEVTEHGEGWQEEWGDVGRVLGAARRKILKDTQGSRGTQVLLSPLQLVVGVEVSYLPG